MFHGYSDLAVAAFSTPDNPQTSMKINDDHMYHGSALTQIAEHPQFTAINAFHRGTQKSRSAFRVNDDVGIYLKYATAATEPFDEYPFTFLQQHLDEIEALSQKTDRLYLIFVCVRAKQICCVRRNELYDLIAKRRLARGYNEALYTILVTCPPGKSFRMYVNVPGARKKKLGEIIVPRNRFPDVVFE